MSALLRVLTQPTGVALCHPSFVFGDVTWRSPVRKIIALTSKNIKRLNGCTVDRASVLIPALASIDNQRATPRLIHFNPSLIRVLNINASFDYRRIRIGFQSLKCCIGTVVITFTPSFIGSTGWALLTKDIVKLLVRQSEPKTRRKLKVKKILRLESTRTSASDSEN